MHRLHACMHARGLSGGKEMRPGTSTFPSTITNLQATCMVLFMISVLLVITGFKIIREAMQLIQLRSLSYAYTAKKGKQLEHIYIWLCQLTVSTMSTLLTLHQLVTTPAAAVCMVCSAADFCIRSTGIGIKLWCGARSVAIHFCCAIQLPCHIQIDT